MTQPQTPPFAAFYEKHRGFVERHVQRLGGHRLQRADVEDVTQVAFIRLLRVYDSIATEAAAMTYLKLAAKSALLDFVRQEGRPRDARVMAALVAQPPRRLTEEVRLEVLDAVSRLPPPQRAAVLLVDIADLRIDDAARVAGIPVPVLKGALQRGREAIRRALAGAAPIAAAWRLRPRRPAFAPVAAVMPAVAALCLAVSYAPALPERDATFPLMEFGAARPVAAGRGSRAAFGPSLTAHPRVVTSPSRTDSSRPRRAARAGTEPSRKEPVELPKAGACAGDVCVGDTEQAGDWLCVGRPGGAGGGEGNDVACAKQDRVAICDHAVSLPGVVRCERHGDAEWIVPPP